MSYIMSGLIDKSLEAKHLKGSSKLIVKKLEKFSNKFLFFQRLRARRHWVDQLHVSSDEAIAQMEDKVKQKQIAEEEKKKRKEEREMKRLTKQKEKEEKAKKSKKANKKGTTKKTQSACLVDGEDEAQKKHSQLIWMTMMLNVLFVVMMILMKSESVVIFVIHGITLDV